MEQTMRIESVTLSGLRSFGSKPGTVDLANDLTTIVGPNASGKTALLQGLSKLFGVTRAQRTVQRSDFHLPQKIIHPQKNHAQVRLDVKIA